MVYGDLDIVFLYDWQAWPIWRISWHPPGPLWSGWSEIKLRRPRSLYKTIIWRRDVPRPTNWRDCTMIPSRSISYASTLKTVNSFKPIQPMKQNISPMFNVLTYILRENWIVLHFLTISLILFMKNYRAHFNVQVALKILLNNCLAIFREKVCLLFFNSVNAVLICSPTSTHEPVIRDSLLAGRIYTIIH